MSAPSSRMAARVEQRVIEGWFVSPPRLISAMAGKPTIGATQAFVLQWTKFSRLFPRWVGAIIANCPEFPVIAYEVQNLMSEVVRDPAADDNHYELLIRLGVGVGLSRSEIESHPVIPEAVALFDWLWMLARDPDWLRGFTAINGLEILGDRTLPGRYGVDQGTGIAAAPYAAALGLDEKTLEFFVVSDEADAGHGHETVAIIARYTPPERENELLEVLDQAIVRLRTMMDAMWELAERLDSDAVRREGP